MKLVTYAVGGQEALGVVVADDQVVINLAAADKALAQSEKRKVHPFFTDMMTLLEAGNKGRVAAKKAVVAAEAKLKKPDGKMSFAIGKVKLRSPLMPRKVLALAGNYRDHIEEGGSMMSKQDAETPRIFMKPPTSTVIGPGEKILIPPVANGVDWEGELAVVMGRKAKGIKAKDALKYVAGYTVMNDVSERKLLIKKRSATRDRDAFFDWLNGKWLDTFAPMGPWIVTSDEIKDPQTLDISTYVNGDRKQHNNTGQMLYKVADIIEYVSTIITLEPGDVISTGTIAGVGNTTGTYMQPGDLVEIEISKIGRLKNPVAASKK
ncbi:MAG: fumarylacetoacetate hydrolase family protein [Candidatus Latescibacterota bacterium]